jgi:hypothetical protein
VDLAVLHHRCTPTDVCVARRMSWAAHCKTTRVEDEAYSLMGLFGVNMPTIYGEGHAAFRRLQEEILRRFMDHTLFLWSRRSPLSSAEHHGGVFANSVSQFSGFHDIETFPLDEYPEAFDAFSHAAGIHCSRKAKVRHLDCILSYSFCQHNVAS